MNDIIPEVETLDDEYAEKLYALGAAKFKKVVEPWIRKHKLQFLNGGTDWWISASDDTPARFWYNLRDKHCQWRADIDKLPQEIQELLCSRTPRFHLCDFGCFMPTLRYPYPEENEN